METLCNIYDEHRYSNYSLENLQNRFMLYKRNYFQLTEEEILGIEKAERYLNSKKAILSSTDFIKYHNLMPDAGYHSKSLFPNNFLIFNYKKHPKIQSTFEEFKNIVNKETSSEQEILNFIKATESYFILESLFYYYDFGHHDSYLFREFPLPPQYVCDFLLIGKSSGGYEFVFIEFEHPNNKSILKTGELGESFRKGIKQVNDWDTWIESNFHTLKNVFNIYKNPKLTLPTEFTELDRSRIHFLVIAGKRKEFNEKAYRHKRKSRKEIRLIHYDNLLDVCEFYIKESKKTLHNTR